MFKNKKGNFIANIFIVIFGLIIFFAMYPAISGLLDIGLSMHSDDPVGGFFISAIPLAIILAVLVWSYRTTIGGTSE